MKILSCHIENFGKIHDYSMKFRDGANIICEENGWGKSTFAAFVRAMFYGLEGDRKRSLEENERKRYKPWQGGVFGGQLVFEIQGRAYLLSRIFKDKEANDEFELRDAATNLPSKDYTGKIGEEIFRINRESFMRTVFIGQSQCETTSTDDINAKIGKLADNSNDLNHFEAANGKLTEILNKLNPNRVSGSLAKRSGEIAGYERIVRGGEGITDSIAEYQKYLHSEEELYERLKSQMKEAGEKQKTVSRQQSVIAKSSEWERLKGNAAQKAEETEMIRQKFPGNIPAMEDVKQKLTECGAMERAWERASMYHFSGEEKEELVSLARIFVKGVPSDRDIQEKISESVQFRKLSQEYSAEQPGSAEKERLEELGKYFADDTEYVTSIVAKWNHRNARKAALPSKQAALMALKASMEARKRQSPRTRSPLLFIGCILAAAGVLAAVGALAAAALSPAAAFSPAIGITIALAGGGCIIAGVLTKGKNSEQKGEGESPEFEDLRRAIEEDEAFVGETDALVANYLAAHGKRFDENTVSSVLQEITAEAIEYSSLKKKVQKAQASSTAADLEALRDLIRAFLGRYGFESANSGFVDDLYILKSKADKFRILMEKRNHYNNAARDYMSLKDSIAAFLKKYGYEPSDNVSAQCGDIRDLVDEYQDSIKLLEEAEKDLKQFEAENNVALLNAARADESLPTLEELSWTIQQLVEEREEVHKEISDCNNILENLQEQYDEWEENCAKLRELKELQSIEQRKYKHVQTAKRKLELAKEAMTAKYADPILQGFRKYYEMISGGNADCFHIDANTTVTVDELGKQRNVNTLSYGYRDLIGICLRIALVDAMFQEEEPVLVMDDPFTNLDDRKVRAGREFVKKLGEKRQIIYFTCSTSRE